MLKFIVFLSDDKVIGLDSKEDVIGALDEYYEEKIAEYCEGEGFDYEDLSPKKRSEICFMIGYDEGECRAYRTRNVIKEIKAYDMCDEEKEELIDELMSQDINFKVDDYDELYDILQEVDEIDI
ncbi:hypothetical protein [Tepidibacter formicigenes]|jgi:hypothetical protein|uniref:Uncharacterized protein n=1 Tax=Tepidibacter formicigenes DSM 15518 TaxID=1123349 RepID=A0A1M6QJD3_9FIRM|nr:hypothetical protein [Tepidibacter formicigenes]SHK20404.1 hypothetical protein SAMN02744037_01869 [Tepidibacter formicigenes DSM 15518]